MLKQLKKLPNCLYVKKRPLKWIKGSCFKKNWQSIWPASKKSWIITVFVANTYNWPSQFDCHCVLDLEKERSLYESKTKNFAQPLSAMNEMACSSSNSYHAKNVDNRSHRAKLKKVFFQIFKNICFQTKKLFSSQMLASFRTSINKWKIPIQMIDCNTAIPEITSRASGAQLAGESEKWKPPLIFFKNRKIVSWFWKDISWFWPSMA